MKVLRYVDINAACGICQNDIYLLKYKFYIHTFTFRPLPPQISSETGTMNAPIVWVMGGPGSGKGTQCQKIVEKYGFTHLDPSAMVNKEIESKSATGKKFEGIRAEGKEVPLEDIIPILETAIMGQRGGLKGFIIDGYPRDKAQASLLEQRIGPPDLIISLEVGQQALETRPRDSKDQGRKVSLTAYQKNAKPVLEQYSNKTMQVDGDRDPNDVFKDLVPNLDVLVKNRGGIQIGR